MVEAREIPKKMDFVILYEYISPNVSFSPWALVLLKYNFMMITGERISVRWFRVDRSFRACLLNTVLIFQHVIPNLLEVSTSMRTHFKWISIFISCTRLYVRRTKWRSTWTRQ